MKRGQLMAQPFVMLFAIIVGALVLTWGMYELYKIADLSGDIQLSSTINDFQRVIDQYLYFNEGSSREYKINLPSKFDKICFYSSELSWDPSGPNLPRSFIEGRADDNTYIFPITEESVFSIKNLKTEGKNPLCFKSSEKIIITSRTSYVGVSKL